MADVKPYVMMDNNMSKSLTSEFLPHFMADCFNYCGIFWPTYIMADVVPMCYG